MHPSIVLHGVMEKTILKHILGAGLALISLVGFSTAARSQEEPVSPNGVRTLSPEGGIIPTATWSLGTRAGDFIYVAGMRGIDPETNSLVPDDEGRVRQAFLNMQLIAESEGASLQDATRLVVYVTDMYRFRPIVNKIQEELWGEGEI
jgi:2-iminobutanoate/2-iminopropanoate deaminase